MKEPKPKQVVILGGVAGTNVARELGRFTKRDPSIQVHLVSNENYFVFQPLLPEGVPCGIEPGHMRRIMKVAPPKHGDPPRPSLDIRPFVGCDTESSAGIHTFRELAKHP